MTYEAVRQSMNLNLDPRIGESVLRTVQSGLNLINCAGIVIAQRLSNLHLATKQQADAKKLDKSTQNSGVKKIDQKKGKPKQTLEELEKNRVLTGLRGG